MSSVSKAGFHLCKLMAMVCLGAQFAGCAQLGLIPQLNVVPFPGRYVEALDPQQVVNLMRRAGFSENETREAGVELRNALAMSGGAKIFRNGHTAAILLVHGRYIHVASWDRNSFMYDTLTDDIQ